MHPIPIQYKHILCIIALLHCSIHGIGIHCNLALFYYFLITLPLFVSLICWLHIVGHLLLETE